MSKSKSGQGAMKLAAEAIWHMPGSFGIARLLGPSYELRCVVFHDISSRESSFTGGMNVSIRPEQFEAKLKFISKHYTPVRLQEVLACSDGGSLPPRAILVTFDDAYVSIVDVAAPLCARYGVPAVFFVNAAFLDNQRLAADNLVCYVANECGMQTITAAVRAVKGPEFPGPKSLAEVFSDFFPRITLAEREAFLEALLKLGGIDERRVAGDARLYLTSKKIAGLASFDFEIGNHTYTHVHCRSLSTEEMAREIDRNKSELEVLSGKPVRAFSVPYGSSLDLTAALAGHLQLTGHKAVFLSESVANERGADRFHLDRVSAHAESDEAFFLEMEVMPRLRAVRNRLFRPALAVAAEAKCTS